MSWNPRYLAYARAHGLDPDNMLARDAEAWPGGKMIGFMLWISGHWQAWRKEHGYRPDDVLSPADNADFDAWIGGTSAETTP